MTTADDRLVHAVNRLQNLPSLSLPTDYPRPSNSLNGVEPDPATLTTEVSDEGCLSLIKLALFTERVGKDNVAAARPSVIHLLIAAFAVIIHRHTGDTDLVLGSSSAASSPDPLVLRLAVNPEDSFWTIVRRVQLGRLEAESDALPLNSIVQALGKNSKSDASGPIFRVAFFDEFDELPEEVVPASSELSVFAACTRTSSIIPHISLRIIYNPALFVSERISFISEQLSVLLCHIATDPSVAIGAVPLLTPSQRAILPDPAGDLDWCGWKGAIPDIFSARARRDPSRPCVVQTISPPNGAFETLTYTYGAIRNAANVLAHYLVQSGVEREDVVMVYAHRSVEMVVAVMAILKIGGVFTVIDPAYPPARQIVYMQVAQPRALIVLKGAGEIHASVRQFYTTELTIVVEVPSLYISPSGDLEISSSSSGDTDVLKSYRHLADTDPDIVLGPDSIGTLSFTSGSTGIPKGVMGRHFSLTHFFPWMGERFGMGERERFTMLSGIAHDPIQRDLFTPLFFGAELHIPTADDIGTPGRLAEWVAFSKISVTHLTPAMSQLLCTQSTTGEIHSLVNAFITGDMLTKRDCLRVQSLFPSARIINMYGSTETQRAVSYYAIPPATVEPSFLEKQKDIIPAGVGMIDVQLLVVNRQDKNVLCAVGEVGEIYIRSGGLSEGYLDEKARAEKFWTNWFADSIERVDTILHPRGGGRPGPEAEQWKGVRDRMYRSGDLGRYLPNGNVECSGRADNQVKIRGFRVELGEIDTLLSQHPLVQENATMVRENKDQEKILVSYFVPVEGPSLDTFVSDDEGGVSSGVEDDMRRYRKVIKDIRDHLKSKLASYSVPSVIIPMARMPLNPNGKIDKPALPFPDFRERADTKLLRVAREATPSEKVMEGIWADLLPNAPSPIPLDESFFDLGGHSILATRLIFEIRKTFVANVPLGIVFHHPTIKELAAEVDALRAAEEGSSAVAEATKTIVAASEYEQDYVRLREKLRDSYSPLAPDFADRPLTVFLTGATGFLGAFILHDLLTKQSAVKKVICLVRAPDAEQALLRLKEGASDRGVWNEEWTKEGTLEVVPGDLSQELYGLGEDTWVRISEEADVVLHNGALVHWVYPYEKLRTPNVLGTLTSIELASTGKQKLLVFVSSTGVLDTEHYVHLSHSALNAPYSGVPESDDLGGSKYLLMTGYSQTKWVAEKLLLEAGQRGLRGHIVRAGYIVGDSHTGVTNTDDFIWRMAKGCIELGFAPDIDNTLNMAPVDHVARFTAIAAIAPPPDETMTVLQITSQDIPTFNVLSTTLADFGFPVEQCDYAAWKHKLEQHVAEMKDTALFPLLHHVLDDLPTNSNAPKLDDTNTRALLKRHTEDLSLGVDDSTFGVYLSWLVGAGFLPAPSVSSPRKALPTLGSSLLTKAAGRRGI